MRQKNLTNIDPMRLAWLVRGDLRRGTPAGEPMSDWFKMWWAIHGPREYPAWTGHAALRESGLFKPLPEWPSDCGFGMTPALKFLLETRQDLAQIFDVSTNNGLWGAIAWMFVHGVRDHLLYPCLDDVTFAALDATWPVSDVDPSTRDEFSLTWLMYFVWLTSTELQARYDLQDTHDRSIYREWFLLEGVTSLDLLQLVAPRWRDWLREPIATPATSVKIQRVGVLLWGRHKQLQQAFDLNTEKGQFGLGLWTVEALNTEPTLAWIGPTDELPKRPEINERKRPFGLNLIGFAFGELGIGEDVRMAVAACQEANIPFAVVNISPGDHLRQADRALAGHVKNSTEMGDDAPYAINVFCLTGFDTARVALERGNALFGGRFNIGWWPWELPVWPRDWLCVFDLVDEVWAATTFTHQMYKEAAALASHTPNVITLMPMAVSVDRIKPIKREDLELPNDSFLFLYVFDFNSYLDRKNPFATVKAFRKAFNSMDKSVGLVVKTMNSNPEDPQWKRFLRECAKDSRITIIDKTLDRGEVLGLIYSCDAYISLHRAEGFGRTLAEAMLFGKPVIGTDFSGNVDFLSNETGFPVWWRRRPVLPGQYPFINQSDRAWWADPIVESAAYQMRRARESMSDFASGTEVSKLSSKFSLTEVGQRIFESIQRYK